MAGRGDVAVAAWTCQETFPLASYYLGSDRSTCSALATVSLLPHPMEPGKAGQRDKAPSLQACAQRWAAHTLHLSKTAIVVHKKQSPFPTHAKPQGLGPLRARWDGGALQVQSRPWLFPSPQLTSGKRWEPSLWPCWQARVTCHGWPMVGGCYSRRLPSPPYSWSAVGRGWPPASGVQDGLGSALQEGHLCVLVPLRVVLALK